MIQASEVGLVSFRNEWQKASISILYTYGYLLNSYSQFFKSYGLTGQQYNVLRILRDHFPQPVSTSFLREKMLDRMSDASRLVNRLKGKGLVEATKNAEDRRLVDIWVSDKGLKLLGAIDKDLHQLDTMMKGLTEGEAKQLVELLHKVRESLKSVNGRLPAAD